MIRNKHDFHCLFENISFVCRSDQSHDTVEQTPEEASLLNSDIVRLSIVHAQPMTVTAFKKLI